MRCHGHELGLHFGQFFFTLQRGHQFVLGQFALADIDIGANHAQRLSPGVTLDHLAAAEHPHPVAVKLAHAGLDMEPGRLALEAAAHQVDNHLPVVRMGQIKRFFELQVALTGGRTAHCGARLVDINIAAHSAPLPDGHL